MEDWQDFIEGFTLATDHERKFAFFDSDLAAGYRRVEHLRAPGFNLAGRRTDRGRTHRAHIDINFSGRKAGENPVRSFGYGAQRFAVGDHRKNEVAGLRRRARRLRPLHAQVEQPLRLGLGAVVTGDVVASIEQPFRHPTAHRAKSDKTKIRRKNLPRLNPIAQMLMLCIASFAILYQTPLVLTLCATPGGVDHKPA